MQKHTALVLGASGLVGREVTKLLIENDHYTSITILVRKKLDISDPKLTQVIIDFNKLQDYANDFQVDDVFCCLGTTIKKAKTKENFKKVDYDYPVLAAKIAEANGAKNYLLISAIGANAKSSNHYLQVKGLVEEKVKDIFSNAVHIFRPSLLTGERDEFRLGEKTGEWAMKLFSFLLIGPLKKYKSIPGNTVAAGMIYAALNGQTGVNIYESHVITQMNSEKLVIMK